MAKKRFKWYGPKVTRIVEQRTEDALEMTAIDIVNDAKLEMKAPKTGKHYPGKPRTSAAPGEPPAVQTGFLRSRVLHERPKPLMRRIGTNVPYGLFQEVGTSKMPAHPWLRPAFHRRRRNFEKYMKKGL